MASPVRVPTCLYEVQHQKCSGLAALQAPRSLHSPTRTQLQLARDSIRASVSPPVSAHICGCAILLIDARSLSSHVSYEVFILFRRQRAFVSVKQSLPTFVLWGNTIGDAAACVESSVVLPSAPTI